MRKKSTLIIQRPLPSWNSLIRLHFHKWHSLQGEWDYLVLEATAARRAWELSGPVEVEVWSKYKRGVLPDIDNQSVKFLIDALRHNGIIEEDNPAVLRRLAIYPPERAPKGIAAHTIVTITKAPA